MTIPNSSPATAWRDLLDGNDRFVSGAPRHPRQDADRRHETAGAQTPTAALFGCSDSRLAAEIIFDEGLGDLFVVRNAGQIISDSVVSSLEYAVAVLNVPLIVVLGHDKCGAVAAAIDSQAAEPPLLPPAIARMIAPLVPAVRAAAEAPAGTALDPAAVDVAEVGRLHLRDTVAELLRTSELIAARVADGSLAVAGVNYRLSEGRAVPDFVVGQVD